MDKSTALREIGRRTGRRLGSRDAHFANINKSKPVWWLDIPLDEVFNEAEPHLHLVLADSSGHVHYLRVPKHWGTKNIESFSVREDKAVISLELSCMPSNLFQDVRPTSERLRLAQFVT